MLIFAAYSLGIFFFKSKFKNEAIQSFNVHCELSFFIFLHNTQYTCVLFL